MPDVAQAIFDRRSDIVPPRDAVQPLACHEIATLHAHADEARQANVEAAAEFKYAVPGIVRLYVGRVAVRGYHRVVEGPDTTAGDPI